MHGQFPTIGLVIPNLNYGQYIAQTLESIFIQKNVNLELAFCDGGSRDQTLSIVLPYRDRFNYFRSGPDRGQAAAINEGISHLKNTNYVHWLNSDDILMPDGLSALANFLDNHPEFIAVFAKAYIIGEKGEFIGEYPTKPFSKRNFAVICSICQPASLIRRSAWEAVGGLDETLQTSIDYDMWWRLSKIGKIGYLNQYVACTRDHAMSKTRILRKKVNEETILILLRHRGMVPRNWCMANILEGLEGESNLPNWKRQWKAFHRYFHVNRWKGLLPQNWLI